MDLADGMEAMVFVANRVVNPTWCASGYHELIAGTDLVAASLFLHQTTIEPMDLRLEASAKFLYSTVSIR